MDSPTVPGRYGMVSKLSDELHSRSSSAPGEYIRDSQTLPATKWASKQAESHPLSSSKGLGLSIPANQPVGTPPLSQGSRRNKLDLRISTEPEKPPPPPPKSPRHSRTASAASAVSSMHGESPLTARTPGSLLNASSLDFSSISMPMPPLLHARQGSLGHSGTLRVREIVVTKDQKSQAKPVVIQNGFRAPDVASIHSKSASLGQYTPTSVLPMEAVQQTPARKVEEPAREESAQTTPRPSVQASSNEAIPLQATGKGEMAAKPTTEQRVDRPPDHGDSLPESLKIGSKPVVQAKTQSVDTTKVADRNADKAPTKATPTHSQKTTPNLDKPMPSLPGPSGELSDHLREVREAESAEKKKRPKMKTSLSSFPTFPTQTAPSGPFAQVELRPGSPVSRLYARAPSPQGPANGSRHDSRAPTPDVARSQTPVSSTTVSTTKMFKTDSPKSSSTHKVVSRTVNGTQHTTTIDHDRSRSPPSAVPRRPRGASVETKQILSKGLSESPQHSESILAGGEEPSASSATTISNMPPASSSLAPAGSKSVPQDGPPPPLPKDVTPNTTAVSTRTPAGIQGSPALSETSSNGATDGSRSSVITSILSKAHAQARSATPDILSSAQKSPDSSAPDFDPTQALKSLSAQVEALQARYAQLRSERLKLSTEITKSLREQKPGPDYVNTLLDQHLSLNAVSSSMDICWAKMKALDCRKEDAITALIERTRAKEAMLQERNLASVFPPALAAHEMGSGRSTPEVEQKTLSPGMLRNGRLSPAPGLHPGSRQPTPDLTKESPRGGPSSTLTPQLPENSVLAARYGVKHNNPTDDDRPPTSPVSAISSLEEERQNLKRIRVKGAKAAKLLGLVAQSSPGKSGNPGITLPDKSSIEKMAAKKELAVEVHIQSKTENTPSPTTGPPVPPKRKPVPSPRQGTNDSVSSATTGESAEDEPEVQTPPSSPEAKLRRQDTKKTVQTIQVFVDDDILEYYHSNAAR